MKSTEQRLAEIESKLAAYRDRLDRVTHAERAILKRCREIAMAEVHGLLADQQGEFNTRSGAIFVSEPEGMQIVWRKQHKSQNASNSPTTKSTLAMIEREERLYYKPATILAHDLADAAGIPGHDAAAHHADHGLHKREQSAAGLPAQRTEGEPTAAGAGGVLDARE